MFDPFGPLKPRTYLNIYFPLLFPVLPCVFVPVKFFKTYLTSVYRRPIMYTNVYGLHPTSALFA